MISDLPALNAVLNSFSVAFLLLGYVMIRRGKVSWHRGFMITAFLTSCLFLASYLFYHYHAGVKHYSGTGVIRTVYLSILGSHTILAAVIPFLAILTLYRGLSARYDRHKRIARWTLPLWLYVSATGVVIYLMLYL